MVKSLGPYIRNLDSINYRNTLCSCDDLGCQCISGTHEEDHCDCFVPYWLRPGEYYLATTFPAPVEGMHPIPNYQRDTNHYKPRYKPTWIILLVVSFFTVLYPLQHVLTVFKVAAVLPSIIIVTLWTYLSRENRRRDEFKESHEVNSSGIVETTDSDGSKVTRVVNNTQMDLTDRENLTL